MSEINVPRRTFLRSAGAMTALSYSRVYGANERVQLGLIGAGDRGRHDTENFVKTGTVDVTAVCDIYGNIGYSVNFSIVIFEWLIRKIVIKSL